jgi:hypothetical protein
MWHDGRGNWNKAHNMVIALEDKTACWVHAYLHVRKGCLERRLLVSQGWQKQARR